MAMCHAPQLFVNDDLIDGGQGQQAAWGTRLELSRNLRQVRAEWPGCTSDCQHRDKQSTATTPDSHSAAQSPWP